MIMNDQARNLRILRDERQHRFHSLVNSDHQRIMVVSGKGGVGKSFFSLHLAQSLANQGERVLLVDSNLQSPNLHLLTNIDSEFPVHYWLAENLPIQEKAVFNLYKNLDVLSNTTSNLPNFEYLANGELFLELLAPLASKYSFVVMDTHTSLSEWNVSLLRYASLGLLLSISEPTSVIDTYTYIKASLPYLQPPNLQLIINQVIEKQNGIEAHHKLNQALHNFLNFQIHLLGLVPFDMDVKRSGMEQKPIWELSRHSVALWEIHKIAQSVRSLIQQKNKENQIKQEVNV